jgi:hypothetical protein
LLFPFFKLGGVDGLDSIVDHVVHGVPPIHLCKHNVIYA